MTVGAAESPARERRRPLVSARLELRGALLRVIDRLAEAPAPDARAAAPSDRGEENEDERGIDPLGAETPLETGSPDGPGSPSEANGVEGVGARSSAADEAARTDVERLFAELTVERLAGGGIRLEAPPR